MPRVTLKDWETTDNLLRLEGWAREGLTNAQIAANMGVSEATLYSYQSRSAEVLEALKRGKAPVDYQVENALLKSALGYTITVKKPIKIRIFDHDEIVMTDEQIHIPPNVTAQIYWLKNRKPQQWRDKREVKADIADTSPITVIADLINHPVPDIDIETVTKGIWGSDNEG